MVYIMGTKVLIVAYICHFWVNHVQVIIQDTWIAKTELCEREPSLTFEFHFLFEVYSRTSYTQKFTVVAFSIIFYSCGMQLF